MGFRKNSYAKVFVDESIPSFLTDREPTVVSISAPKHAPAQHEKAEEHTHELVEERRNQPMRVRPVFVAQLVVVTLLLNAVLSIGLQAGQSWLLRLAPAAIPPQPSVEPTVSEESEPIVTYSYERIPTEPPR